MNENKNTYEFERKCLQKGLGRVSTLLSLTNNDEVDNIMKLTNCMNSIVCQIQNLDESYVSLYGVDINKSSGEDDKIDFTVE